MSMTLEEQIAQLGFGRILTDEEYKEYYSKNVNEDDDDDDSQNA